MRITRFITLTQNLDFYSRVDTRTQGARERANSLDRVSLAADNASGVVLRTRNLDERSPIAIGNIKCYGILIAYKTTHDVFHKVSYLVGRKFAVLKR